MSNNVHFVQLEAYKPPVAIEDKKNDWVNYGDNNNYFGYLIDLYTKSTTNNAVINNINKLVYGKGLSAKDARVKPNDYATLIKMFSKSTIKKVVKDYKTLGNFAFQVIYNAKKDNVDRVEHIPVHLLRAKKCDKDGNITGYYYSDNWNDIKNFPPKLIPAFGYGTNSEKIEIFYVMNYTLSAKYYGAVDYEGGLPYAKLEEEISEYLINEVQNGFAPTSVVNFNNGIPTEEEQVIIKRKVEGTLTGSRGKRVVVAFNNDETKKTTVDSIPLNDAPEHYSYLSTEASSKIMLSHNVTSPLLFGIASNNGFSSNADELRNSYILFDNMVIKPIQETILDAIDTILAFNKISLNLYFKDLQPLDVEGDLTKENNTNLSAEKDTPDDLAEALISKGETLGKEWILIDENDVDYENEDEFDGEINFLNQPKKKSLFQRFASAVTARPNAKSEQDDNIDGIKFLTRYKYDGNPNPERGFCKKMMNANRVYRKEDLVNVDSNSVNPGFGHKGQSYNIFEFKGGPRCHHKFTRQTYVSFDNVKIDVNNPNATKISVAKAEKYGYRVRNSKYVSMMPNDMQNKGFHPDNNNLPIDAK